MSTLQIRLIGRYADTGRVSFARYGVPITVVRLGVGALYVGVMMIL